MTPVRALRPFLQPIRGSRWATSQLTRRTALAIISPSTHRGSRSILARVFHSLALEEPIYSGEQNLGYREADRAINSICMSWHPRRVVLLCYK